MIKVHFESCQLESLLKDCEAELARRMQKGYCGTDKGIYEIETLINIIKVNDSVNITVDGELLRMIYNV